MALFNLMTTVAATLTVASAGLMTLACQGGQSARRLPEDPPVSANQETERENTRKPLLAEQPAKLGRDVAQGSPSKVVAPKPAAAPSVTMESLGIEIKAMVKSSRCETDSDCRAIGFGVKACGGPHEYLYYSEKSIDENALKDKVATYNQLNQKENAAKQIMSTCDMVMPETPRCVATGSEKVCKVIPD